MEKTRKKNAVTLHITTFKAHETLLYCPECKRIYGSEKLHKLIASGCKFGYDVMGYVGRAMFISCRNEKEIKLELAGKHHLIISKREISYLAKKFIVYLSLAHRENAKKIKNLMNENGGYILHLDASCEGESPHLLSAMDGITEIVLQNALVSSEKAEKIIPFLQEIKQLYGNPLALVHDMGRAILKAVKKVFPTIIDLICHWHFLADLGKDLFGGENDTIRKQLSNLGIQGRLRKRAAECKGVIDENPHLVESLVKSLKEKTIQKRMLNLMPVAAAYSGVLWALAGKKLGKGYGFPFDRPYLTFYERLEVLYSTLRQLNAITLSNDRKDNKPYVKIIRDLHETMEDKILRKAAGRMQEKNAVFDKLRDAMRIAVPEGKRGLNDRGDEEDIRTIEKRVEKFCEWLSNHETFSKEEDYKKMLDQIKKYWNKLFSDPIVVDTPKGKITIQPQRTNNILERLFREVKRSYRKKSGTKALGRVMRAMLADMPFVRNLDNPEYMKIILNGKETLEEMFAEIDIKIVRKQMSMLENQPEKIPWQIKKIIQQPDLPKALVALFTN